MSPHKLLRNCASWHDFRAYVSKLSRTEKGDCFEVLVKHFLELHPKYATQLSRIWHIDFVPEEIRTRLNLPAPDEGIDLIAETKEGGYWAIQCKFRDDESSSLGRDELSTFTDLAFVVCKNIELALVCTTTERFSRKLKLYGERLSVCAADVWRGLDEEFFQRLHQLLAGEAAPIEPSTPRPHQLLALKDAYMHFATEGNARGKLIMPCGTGKSLTAYWIAEELKARTILVAVPSLALVRQTLEVWTREALAHRRNLHWMAVCSDESVGQVERDDVAVLTQDLGIRVHTHPDEIAAWLREPRQGATVVFTTYQSGPATAEATRKAGITFDIGIMDEAHKTVGRKGNLFGHLLHEENIGITKRLFMTATERYYRGDSDNVVSMNDPHLYGDMFHLLSFKNALESHPPILADYKIITIGVTRAEVAALVARNAFVRPDRRGWSEDVEAEMFAAVIALRKAMRHHPIRHVVSFHQSIARALLFKENIDAFSVAFPEYGPLASFHVSGTTPTAERSRILDMFAIAGRGLVTNARCLTEGVDVPDIDCVLFADPKKSAIDIVQAVGRALRTTDKKLLGYIVVPVLLEMGESEIVFATGGEQFEAVFTVLRALAASDERIVEYFRSVAEGKKRLGNTKPFEIELTEGMVINAEQFVESIELRLWPKLAKLSWRPFAEARQFAQSLELKRPFAWAQFCHGELPEKGVLPEDIPAHPEIVFRDRGWNGWEDWLGTGVEPKQPRRAYRLFEEARQFVHGLSLTSESEWLRYCRGELPDKAPLPMDIPKNPRFIYKHRGWVDMLDWVGTKPAKSQPDQYLSFARARQFVQGLNLKSEKAWRDFSRGKLPEKGNLPENVPAHPEIAFQDSGWKGWIDWLGKEATRPTRYRSFDEARRFVQELGLKDEREWRKYCRGKLPEKGNLPENIPARPEIAYAYQDRGWSGWTDWLGKEATRPTRYRSFDEARQFVHGLSLTSEDEWRQYCRGELPDKGAVPKDIPAVAWRVYEGRGWVSWDDWLGTRTLSSRIQQYRSFEEARQFVHGLGLKDITEWRQYCRGQLPEKGALPANIPATPESVFKDLGWDGMPDWLGTKQSDMRE